MKSLASVQKSAGLNSILNALKKLPGIVNSLDSATLALFTLRIQQLASALRPLATELERVGTAFLQLPARIQQIVTATNRMTRACEEATNCHDSHADSLNAGTINMAAGISVIQSYIEALQWVRDGLTAAIADAIEWDGIQYRFGRAFGEDAEETLKYVDKVSEALEINKQQFMQYSSLYGSLLSGFGMEQEKITAISIGLTELSYDIWAAYNDRYKTLEDASEAVRSAITGEIEPIRNAGIALTEASMQEYLDNLGLAHVRMANLSEAQKSQVRYAVMVNSAMNQGIVGSYAAEMHTAEGAVRTLSQQMKGLGQAIGSIFIPILSAVVPYLSAFVSLLYDAIEALARILGIPFFKIDWGTPTKGAQDMGEGLGAVADGAGAAKEALGDAGKAAKKLQDYTMGFDELNIIQPPSDSGSGGAGGKGKGPSGADIASDWEGLDLDTLWDESILAKASKQVDELKQKILDWLDRWKIELAIIGAALATMSVAMLLSNIGEAIGLGSTFLGVMKNIKKLAATAIVITLLFSLMKASFSSFLSEDGSIWDYVKGMLIGGVATWVLYAKWGAAGLAIGFAVTAFASLSAVVEDGGFNAETALLGFTGLASGIAAFVIAWKKAGLGYVIGEIGAFFSLLREGNSLPSVLAAAFPRLATAITPVLGEIGAFIQLLRDGNSLWSVLAATFPGISTAISTAATAVGTFLAGLTGPVIAAAVGIIAALASVVMFLYRNLDKVKEAVKEFFKTNIVPKLKDMKESWEDIKDALSPVAVKLKPIIKYIKNLIKEFKKWTAKVKPLEKALKWLGDVMEVVGGVIFGLFTGAIAGAFSMAVSIIEGFIKTVSGLIQIVTGVIEFVIAIFTGGDVEKAVDKMMSGIADYFEGLWTMVSAPIVEFWNGVVDWFQSLYDELVGHSIVPDMIDAIVDWFLSLPKRIFGSVEDFAKGIIERFKKMWSDIQGWWGSSVAPKFTTEYWKEVFDAVRSGASAKLQEVKKIASDKWDETKAWFNTNVAPKFTLSYWKGIFGTVRDALSTKLSEAKKAASDKWTELAGWYNKSVAPKFTLNYWKSKLDPIRSAFSTKFYEARRAVYDRWVELAGWYHKSVAPKFTLNYWKNKLDPIRSAFSTKFYEARRAVYDRWVELRDWYNKSVAPKFTLNYWKSKLDSIRSAFNTKLYEAKKAASDKWSELKNWYNKNVSPKFTKTFWESKFSGLKDGLIQAIRNGINGAVSKINSFISWLNKNLKINLPAVKVAGKKIFDGATFTVVTIPSIPRFETGGFIEDGLFTMNRGEIAGKFTGGKSVVANNQMIIEGIAAGVYEAVLAAMNDARSSESQAVNVYLDGKQIYASVKKTESERGVQLMGNQLGYSY